MWALYKQSSDLVHYFIRAYDRIIAIINTVSIDNWYLYYTHCADVTGLALNDRLVLFWPLPAYNRVLSRSMV